MPPPPAALPGTVAPPSARPRGLGVAFLWITTSQIGTMLASLLLVRVATEHLAPAEYGRLGLALTVTALVHQLWFGPWAQGAVRHFQLAVERHQLGVYAQGLRGLATRGAAALGVAAGIALLLLVVAGQGGQGPLLMLALAFAVLTGTVAALAAAQHAVLARSAASAGPLVEAWLRVALVLWMLSAVAASAEMALAAYALAACPVVLWQLAWMRRLRSVQPSAAAASAESWTAQRWQRETMTYCWPFMLWGPFTWAQQNVDRWVLDGVAGRDGLGLYLVAFQLGYAPMSMAATVAITLFQPVINRMATGEASPPGDRRALRWVAVVGGLGLGFSVMAAALAGLVHEQVFAALVAPPYRAAAALWPWLVLAGGLFGCGQVLGMQLAAERRPRDMLAVKVLTALVAVTAAWLGAARWGLQGAVAAQLLFSLIYLAGMVWAVRRGGGGGRARVRTI